MALVEWKEEFRTGIPSIDHEHESLIALINQIHAGLATQTDKVQVEGVLGEIHARISAHFALEERVMRERRYDQYQDHKMDHENLLDEIRDIMERVEDDPHFRHAPTLSAQLSEWFAGHFRTKDARLHKMLGGAGH
jgi:hemerythrin